MSEPLQLATGSGKRASFPSTTVAGLRDGIESHRPLIRDNVIQKCCDASTCGPDLSPPYLGSPGISYEKCREALEIIAWKEGK